MSVVSLQSHRDIYRTDDLIVGAIIIFYAYLQWEIRSGLCIEYSSKPVYNIYARQTTAMTGVPQLK